MTQINYSNALHLHQRSIFCISGSWLFQRSGTFFISGLFLSLIFAWMEPAGSSKLSLFLQFVIWLLQIPLSLCILITTQSHLTKLTRLNPWIVTVLSGLIGAFLFTPVAYCVDIIFNNQEDLSLISGLIDEAGGVILPVTLTWVALNVPFLLRLSFKVQAAPCLKGVELAVAEKITGKIYSFSAELHYLRAVTESGETLILYNLKDAIEEMGKNAGIQIHRSHWVSTNGFKAFTKKEGQLFCQLLDNK